VDDLSPPRYAALVAPAIDRVHLSVHERTRRDHGATLMRYGVPRRGLGLLVSLRFVLPRGALRRPAFALAARYHDPAEVDRAVGELVADGWLVPDEHGPAPDALTPDERCAAFLHALYDAHAEVTTAAWEPRATSLPGLAAMAGRLLAGAVPSGGPSFDVFCPPYERAGDPPGVLLFNRLAALRYHRSDAHVAAWSAAGLTAATMRGLAADDPRRAGIEAETDRLAAPAYGVLSTAERLDLLAGLATLA